MDNKKTILVITITIAIVAILGIGMIAAINFIPIGKFRPKGIIKAIKVNENIVFDTSWGEKMAVKAGGWVADGGYAIAEDSFNNTYEKIEEKK